jgi:hypothetical protein
VSQLTPCVRRFGNALKTSTRTDSATNLHRRQLRVNLPRVSEGGVDYPRVTCHASTFPIVPPEPSVYLSIDLALRSGVHQFTTFRLLPDYLDSIRSSNGSISLTSLLFCLKKPTCHPSPCSWLSQPLTTTMTPIP